MRGEIEDWERRLCLEVEVLIEIARCVANGGGNDQLSRFCAGHVACLAVLQNSVKVSAGVQVEMRREGGASQLELVVYMSTYKPPVRDSTMHRPTVAVHQLGKR